jgi:hypothetical protein
MKLEHNCVTFDMDNRYQSFHATDITQMRCRSQKVHGDLSHIIVVLTREGSQQEEYEFIVSSETPREQIVQFIDSVYKARRDFNSQPNLLPIH